MNKKRTHAAVALVTLPAILVLSTAATASAREDAPHTWTAAAVFDSVSEDPNYAGMKTVHGDLVVMWKLGTTATVPDGIAVEWVPFSESELADEA